jgi:transcriptional antiterminator NusG
MSSHWYVLKVIPGKERNITENLNQQISLGRINNIHRFVCPTEKEFITVKNKKVLREKVLYNGYLYFESKHILNEDELKDFSSIPNVMGMLGDKKPLLMRQNDVDRILKDEVLEGYVENKKLKFLIGEEVNIIDGPFQSFVGLIYKLYDDEKIDLDVKIFGRSSIVSLNTNQIAKKL